VTEYAGKDTLEILESARNYSRFLVSEIKSITRSSDRVMDFGAGTGHIASQVIGSVRDLVAVEADTDLLEKLVERGIPSSELEALADDSFDVIYSLNVLEHIENDADAVTALTRKLRPGGVLFIYVPAFPILYSEFDARIGHFRRYTKKTAFSMLSKSPLDAVEVRFHDPIGFFVALVYRLFVRSGSVGQGSVQVFDSFIFPLSRILEPVTRKMWGKNLSVSARKGRASTSGQEN
jgi:SAM-dependent methyltransferase